MCWAGIRLSCCEIVDNRYCGSTSQKASGPARVRRRSRDGAPSGADPQRAFREYPSRPLPDLAGGQKRAKRPAAGGCRLGRVNGDPIAALNLGVTHGAFGGMELLRHRIGRLYLGRLPFFCRNVFF